MSDTNFLLYFEQLYDKILSYLAQSCKRILLQQETSWSIIVPEGPHRGRCLQLLALTQLR